MNMNAHKDIQWGRQVTDTPLAFIWLYQGESSFSLIPLSIVNRSSTSLIIMLSLLIKHDKEEDVILNCAQECVLKLSPQPAQVGRFKSDFQIWIFYQSFTLTRQKLRAQYSRVFSSTDTAEELVKIVGGNCTLYLSLLFQCLAPTSPSLANWVENIYQQPHHHHHQGQLKHN